MNNKLINPMGSLFDQFFNQYKSEYSQKIKSIYFINGKSFYYDKKCANE